MSDSNTFYANNPGGFTSADTTGDGIIDQIVIDTNGDNFADIRISSDSGFVETPQVPEPNFGETTADYEPSFGASKAEFDFDKNSRPGYIPGIGLAPTTFFDPEDMGHRGPSFGSTPAEYAPSPDVHAEMSDGVSDADLNASLYENVDNLALDIANFYRDMGIEVNGNYSAFGLDMDENGIEETFVVDLGNNETIDGIGIDLDENTLFDAIGVDANDSGFIDTFMLDYDNSGSIDDIIGIEDILDIDEL